VRFNPFLFKLEVKSFRLQEADGRPLLAFDRLFVDFELTSVVRKAWTFAKIELDAPRVDAILTHDGRLNLLDLLDALPQSDPAICGSATFAIEVSSTSMKVASVTVSAINHGLWLGFHSCVIGLQQLCIRVLI